MGATIDTVNAALGHSKSVTDIYVNYDGRLVDEAQKKVFHAVFDQIVGKGQKDKVTKMSSAMSATDDDW